MKIKLTLFTQQMKAYNSSRKRKCLTRSGLLQPNASAWVKLFQGGDNSFFLTITGFTRPVFQHLKSILFPEMDLPKCGRPTEDDRLGIFLVYLGSSMQTKWISMIFGACPSTVSEVIDKMPLKVVMFFKYHIHARIKFPDDQKMVEYSRLVQLRDPTVQNIIGFVDGLSLPVQCSEDAIEQSKIYNEWLLSRHKSRQCFHIWT
jgi:hypothetical protein